MKFDVTARGLLCLVPAMSRIDDCITIILRCPMPLLLRPNGELDEIIGDCYVHAMMESQASNLIEEFKCKHVPDAISLVSERSSPASLLTRDGANHGVDDYSRILPTLGKRWINVI